MTFKKLVILLCLLPFIIIGIDKADLIFARYIYHLGGSAFFDTPLLRWIYRYGVLPAQLIALASFLIWSLSYLLPKLEKYRKTTLFLWLVLAVSSGFIINGFFKEHWNRPRPCQLTEFGSCRAFRPFLAAEFTLQRAQYYKSFPSGHSSLGFYFYAVYRLGVLYRKKYLKIFGMTTTVLLGILLSSTRMLQGGHFFSDTVASLMIVIVVTRGVEWMLWKQFESKAA